MVSNGLLAYIFFVRLPGIIMAANTPASAASSGIGLYVNGLIEKFLINALHDELCLWLTSSSAFNNSFILALLQL